jgi:hypothetical protein
MDPTDTKLCQRLHLMLVDLSTPVYPVLIRLFCVWTLECFMA